MFSPDCFFFIYGFRYAMRVKLDDKMQAFRIFSHSLGTKTEISCWTLQRDEEVMAR